MYRRRSLLKRMPAELPVSHLSLRMPEAPVRVGINKWFDPATLTYFEKPAPKPKRSRTPAPAVVPVQVQPALKPPPQRKASSAALARDALRNPNNVTGGLYMHAPSRACHSCTASDSLAGGCQNH